MAHKALYSKLIPVGEEKNKLMVVLWANGCERALKKSPCINCGFSNFSANASGETVASRDYIFQLKDVLEQHNPYKQNIGQIEIYVSGSFFNDNEVQPEARAGICETIADYNCIRKVLVESRPEHISQDKIIEAKNLLKSKELEVGIGLETANDQIRQRCINKGFLRKDFEQAVNYLAFENVSLLAYLLIKPAYLSEREAIRDAIESAKYVFKTGRNANIKTRIEYGTTFVQKDTELYKIYEKGEFKPAWLWSVVKIIEGTGYLGDVAVAPREDELMPISRIVASRENRNIHGRKCGCSEKIEQLIAGYNGDKNLDAFLLNLPSCECKDLWRNEV